MRLQSRFLRYLKIPSLSLQERRFAQLLKRELKSLGLSIYEDQAAKAIGGDCGNLYAWLKGSIKNFPVILLNAHLDTVAHQGKINPQIKGNRIYSDKKTILAADDKAGVAVIMETLTLLKEKNIQHGDLLVVFTVAEEIGIYGAKNLEKSRIQKADLGFALDGGDIHLIENQAPAQYNLTAEILGKAAHAGLHPEDGINAIKVAAEAIARMKIGRIDEETTANIGVIEGGKATNIIPERVSLKGEIRSHNPGKLKRQIVQLRKILTQACQQHKARIKIQFQRVYDSFKVNENSEIIRLVKNAARDLGLNLKIQPTGGGSDANLLNSFGIPTVILGTGGGRYHTPAEYLRIPQMQKSVELLLSICQKKN